MTPNPNPKPSLQNALPAGQTAPTGTGAYSPSVPISVYRELAAELQATRVMLDSLNAQNKQLVQQNQQLRHEVEKVVHAALHLQQLADSSLPGSWNQPPYTHPELRLDPKIPAQKQRSTSRRHQPGLGSAYSVPPVDVPATFSPGNPEFSAFSDRIVTEQAEGRYRRRQHPERNSDINGWWLTLVIFLIVVTAFGAGYLLMRPLLPKR